MIELKSLSGLPILSLSSTSGLGPEADLTYPTHIASAGLLLSFIGIGDMSEISLSVNIVFVGGLRYPVMSVLESVHSVVIL